MSPTPGEILVETAHVTFGKGVDDVKVPLFENHVNVPVVTAVFLGGEDTAVDSNVFINSVKPASAYAPIGDGRTWVVDVSHSGQNQAGGIFIQLHAMSYT